MTFKEAKKLKIGDEVVVKKTKKALRIVGIWYQSLEWIIFRLSNGMTYDRLEIMSKDKVRKPFRQSAVIDTAVNLIYDLLNEIDVNDLEYMSHIDLAEKWVTEIKSGISANTVIGEKEMKEKLKEFIREEAKKLYYGEINS